MITIAIADDHPIVLDGLEALFTRQEGFKVVARCETAEEALHAVIKKKPDILVLDVQMPGKDGLGCSSSSAIARRRESSYLREALKSEK